MSEPAAGGPRLPGLGGHCGQGAGHPGEQGRDQGRDQGLAQAPVRAPGRQVSADHGSLVTDHHLQVQTYRRRVSIPLPPGVCSLQCRLLDQLPH